MHTLEHHASRDSIPVLFTQDDWAFTFHKIYERAITQFERGLRGTDQVVDSSTSPFLGSIGMSQQELYDFVEDGVVAGEPTFEEVLRITHLRRHYFLTVQKAQPSTRRLSTDDFPPGQATLGGYRWLPRILAKANAKLRGELPSDLMYSCGNDRAFLQPLGIMPFEFLEKVWQYEGHENQLLEYIKLKQKT